MTALTDDTEVFRLRNTDYVKFQNNESKEKLLIADLVIEKLPGLKFSSSNRKRSIVVQFKEVEFEPNTLLEMQEIPNAPWDDNEDGEKGMEVNGTSNDGMTAVYGEEYIMIKMMQMN